MTGNRGGRRAGAGRKAGSKNKKTIAKEAVADVVEVENPHRLEQAIHERGHRLLVEMEKIALDPTLPVAARIMAAKVALPFLLAKQAEPQAASGITHAELVARINRGRDMAANFELEARPRLRARQNVVEDNEGVQVPSAS